jgi:hypothetical protein
MLVQPCNIGLHIRVSGDLIKPADYLYAKDNAVLWIRKVVGD